MSINTLKGQSDVYPNGDYEVFLNVIGSLQNPILLNGGVNTIFVGDTLPISLQGTILSVFLNGDLGEYVNLVGKLDGYLPTIKADLTTITSDRTIVTIDRT